MVSTVYFKVHQTPNFFFAQINLHIMWSKSPQKFFDLLESSKYSPYFCLKYGKFNKKGGHIGSRPRFRGMGLAVYGVKTRTRRSSVSTFSLCLLASQVESP